MLAALKAYAFIQLRRGNRDDSAAALDVLLRLDPEDGVVDQHHRTPALGPGQYVLERRFHGRDVEAKLS